MNIQSKTLDAIVNECTRVLKPYDIADTVWEGYSRVTRNLISEGYFTPAEYDQWKLAVHGNGRASIFVDHVHSPKEFHLVLAKLVRYCRDHGVVTIELTAQYDYCPAAYAKHGFEHVYSSTDKLMQFIVA